jgi:hypothetical protein
MASFTSKTLLYQPFTDELNTEKTITKSHAEEIFHFFKQCKLFRWKDANNDCEDRANAICILLDEWNIPNYKAWVFSGWFLNKGTGSLNNTWNYHVAPLLPVHSDDLIKYFVLDPATTDDLITIEAWAANITASPFSYHFIRDSSYYIFPSGKIEKDNWYKRNKRNYRWTMQGLSGINAVSPKGKAQLSFAKHRVKSAELAFTQLKCNKPHFTSDNES